MCVYIPRQSDRTQLSVGTRAVMVPFSSTASPFSFSPMPKPLFFVPRRAWVALESDITVEHSSRYNFNTDHYSRQNVQYTGMFSTCPVERARGPRKVDRHKIGTASDLQHDV